MIGFQEIGRDTNEIIERFKNKVSQEHIQAVKKELDIV